MTRFLQENDQLLIIDNNGSISWKGCINNWPIARVVEITNKDKAVVLLSYYKWNKQQGLNLFCIDKQGIICWQSSYKVHTQSIDLIVDVEAQLEEIFATSWNGNRFIVDKDSGALTHICFTK